MQGLLAYSGSSKTNSFQLTKYSPKPPSNLFTLPAGATTQRLSASGPLPARRSLADRAPGL